MWLISTRGNVCAQAPPSGPFTTVGGRLTLGAQISASVGTNDDHYFNYSTYDYGLLRLGRVDGLADFRVNDRLALLADLRALVSIDSGNWLVRPYAAFLRFRPWVDRAFDVQGGLIPPVFGAFSRRAYDTDNPLIGYPLAYQYLTSLRSDAVPASIDDLLRMRGQGWQASYPIGDATPAEGLPLVDGIRYQLGVEAHAGNLQPFEADIAWTAGALSTPANVRGNLGRQISGRVAARPLPGVVLGVSGSRGTFLSRTLLDAAAISPPGTQQAFGFDAEYSRNHWLIRSEGILTNWRIPALADTHAPLSLRAFALDFEGRYRLTPALYIAARIDRLTFNDVPAVSGPTPWDLPVRRLEVGGGYSLWRNALVKAEWQRNYREAAGGYDLSSTGAWNNFDLVSAQVVVWF